MGNKLERGIGLWAVFLAMQPLHEACNESGAPRIRLLNLLIKLVSIVGLGSPAMGKERGWCLQRQKQEHHTGMWEVRKVKFAS